jgi:hypothetical protein
MKTLSSTPFKVRKKNSSFIHVLKGLEKRLFRVAYRESINKRLLKLQHGLLVLKKFGSSPIQATVLH